MKIHMGLFSVLLSLTILNTVSFAELSSASAPATLTHEAATWVASKTQAIISNNPEIRPTGLKKALEYFYLRRDQFSNQSYLTFIDFDLSSRAKRLFLIDLNNNTSKSYLVAHGQNSGEDYATKFSNIPNSYQSSVGGYKTLESYDGANGFSLRLNGLESTNSNAFERAIVLHGAGYVSDEIAQNQPRLGRSWGCPAIDLQFVNDVIHKIQNGSLLYIYSSLVIKQN